MKKPYSELLEMAEDRNLPQMAEYLENNAIELSLPKIILNKKTEKNFLLS